MLFHVCSHDDGIDLKYCYYQRQIAYTESIFCICTNSEIKIYNIWNHKLLSVIDIEFARVYTFYNNIFVITETGLYKVSKDLTSLIPMYVIDMHHHFYVRSTMTEYHMMIIYRNSFDSAISFEIFRDATFNVVKYDTYKILTGLNKYRNLIFYDDDVSFVTGGGNIVKRAFVRSPKKLFLNATNNVLSFVDAETNNVVATMTCQHNIYSVKSCQFFKSRFILYFIHADDIMYDINDDLSLTVVPPKIIGRYLIVPAKLCGRSRKSLTAINGFHDIVINTC